MSIYLALSQVQTDKFLMIHVSYKLHVELQLAKIFFRCKCDFLVASRAGTGIFFSCESGCNLQVRFFKSHVSCNRKMVHTVQKILTQ
jgi:hypothetical protein